MAGQGGPAGRGAPAPSPHGRSGSEPSWASYWLAGVFAWGWTLWLCRWFVAVAHPTVYFAGLNMAFFEAGLPAKFHVPKSSAALDFAVTHLLHLLVGFWLAAPRQKGVDAVLACLKALPWGALLSTVLTSAVAAAGLFIALDYGLLSSSLASGDRASLCLYWFGWFCATLALHFYQYAMQQLARILHLD